MTDDHGTDPAAIAAAEIPADEALAGLRRRGSAGRGHRKPHSRRRLRLLHPPAILADLDRELSAAYVDGLRDGGWQGDEREVRLAICASAVKYDCIVAGMLMRSDQDVQSTYGLAPAVATGELFGVRAAVMRFLTGWADEARRLAAALGGAAG
jgi:hypothetical protein